MLNLKFEKITKFTLTASEASVCLCRKVHTHTCVHLGVPVHMTPSVMCFRGAMEIKARQELRTPSLGPSGSDNQETALEGLQQGAESLCRNAKVAYIFLPGSA